MKPPKKIRIDELLVTRGLADSRTRAKAMILAGKVRRGAERLDKPGREVPVDIDIELESPPRFVSRGGEKLAAYLEHFDIRPDGKSALDVGASTGGFTDCLLQAGAAHVTCVDVGRAQLHARLLQDPRVINLEQVNARLLRSGDLPRETYSIAVIDVSFISLRSILPAVWAFVDDDGYCIALVKPQFEAGKAEADKGRGVIRDPAVRRETLDRILGFARTELPGAEEIGWIESPVEGADGNREYLAGWRKR